MKLLPQMAGKREDTSKTCIKIHVTNNIKSTNAIKMPNVAFCDSTLSNRVFIIGLSSLQKLKKMLLTLPNLSIPAYADENVKAIWVCNAFFFSNILGTKRVAPKFVPQLQHNSWLLQLLTHNAGS